MALLIKQLPDQSYLNDKRLFCNELSVSNLGVVEVHWSFVVLKMNKINNSSQMLLLYKVVRINFQLECQSDQVDGIHNELQLAKWRYLGSWF